MKKYLAELIGTFVLTFMGCGTAVALSCGSDAVSVVGTAVAFGLSVVAMAYTIGGISGCHINPAVSLGVFLSGRMSLKDCGMYMAAQIIGALLAAAALACITSTVAGDPLVSSTLTGANVCHFGVTNGLIVEVFLSLIFVLVVLGATSSPLSSSIWWASSSRAPRPIPHVLSDRQSSKVARRYPTFGCSSLVRWWVARSLR